MTTFWCYAPLSEEPEAGELPALTAGYVTFGSLHSFKKVSDASLSLWAQVLEAVPNSRLLIVAPVGKARERVTRALAERDIAPARLELIGHLARPEYLKAYRRVDLCLDPTPYNGATTSLDAFWMGVPVLTLPGSTVVSRAGASLARNLGLPELVATSAQDYVTRAVSLATDLNQLAQLRRGLRARMQQSPLMDAQSFARHLEAAYRGVWQCWCEAAPSSGA